MFFIISLLVRIKEDKAIRENDYNIIREINDFLSIYGQCGNEQKIEQALAKREELKNFIDMYLYRLEEQEIQKMLQEAEAQNQQKQKTDIQKNPPQPTPPTL